MTTPDDHVSKRRRHLPHWELAGSVYFLTFRSARGQLPDIARRQVMIHVLHDHDLRYRLHFAVVMHDHVHIILEPLKSPSGGYFGLTEIMRGIKGASARMINKRLNTSGPVWQEESFDRIIRDQDEYNRKMEYMWHNPVGAGLVDDPEMYPYFVWPPERPEQW